MNQQSDPRRYRYLEPSSWFPAFDYWIDACQRSVLFLDVLRERGNDYLEHTAQPVPNVLTFEVELVLDGRTLPRPVNYGLVRVVSPPHIIIDPVKQPFVVVDPRAGHGPGIGGMKQESEIGVALAAGHPCYFIGFLPEPLPGQTIGDVCAAEAKFIEAVAARHPTAEGKPVIVANCQAGWQIVMTAAMRPDLPGPIILVGSPLSYWAGVRGKNPMRYLGGTLGGTWLTALTGDLGHGIFDGANLVANFESLNPANTYWQKAYNIYSKVDSEAERFLEFETWWGSPVLLNAEEMQWIADNLFVGNKLATGQLRSSDGLRIDLRNIKSPIIVFCSWGDNITPPQQALGWITDLYDHDREIVANGQTIVYTLHQSIGHLGIFVSGKVAAKEHEEFATCIDMIEMMPPGLYEAVISEVEPGMANPDLVQGRYLFKLEARSLDDIRKIVDNAPEDDVRFAAAARVSEVNLGLYQTLAAPAVRSMTTDAAAEMMRSAHPNRLRFAMFSDQNPAMQPVKAMADAVREARQPVAPDNPFVALEKAVSSGIAFWLEAYGKARDEMSEALFINLYGSPVLQAMVGLSTEATQTRRHVERDLMREADEARMLADLEKRFSTGGLADAALRSLVYVCLPWGSVDERGFTVLKAVRAAQPPEKRLSLGELKEMLRIQYLLIRLDELRAVRAIPAMLPADRAQRRAVLEAVRRVATSRGPLPPEVSRRLEEIEGLFGAKSAPQPQQETVSA